MADAVLAASARSAVDAAYLAEWRRRVETSRRTCLFSRGWRIHSHPCARRESRRKTEDDRDNCPVLHQGRTIINS